MVQHPQPGCWIEQHKSPHYGWTHGRRVGYSMRSPRQGNATALTWVGLRLPVVLLVLRPAAAEALGRAVVRQVLRHLGAQADGALDRRLLLRVDAADGASAGDGAAEPARPQLPRARAGGLALGRHVLRRLHRLAALDEDVGLERDGRDRRVAGREAHVDDRDHLHGGCGSQGGACGGRGVCEPLSASLKVLSSPAHHAAGRTHCQDAGMHTAAQRTRAPSRTLLRPCTQCNRSAARGPRTALPRQARHLSRSASLPDPHRCVSELGSGLGPLNDLLSPTLAPAHGRQGRVMTYETPLSRGCFQRITMGCWATWVARLSKGMILLGPRRQHWARCIFPLCRVLREAMRSLEPPHEPGLDVCSQTSVFHGRRKGSRRPIHWSKGITRIICSSGAPPRSFHSHADLSLPFPWCSRWQLSL